MVTEASSYSDEKRKTGGITEDTDDVMDTNDYVRDKDFPLKIPLQKYLMTNKHVKNRNCL